MRRCPSLYRAATVRPLPSCPAGRRRGAPRRRVREPVRNKSRRSCELSRPSPAGPDVTETSGSVSPVPCATEAARGMLYAARISPLTALAALTDPPLRPEAGALRPGNVTAPRPCRERATAVEARAALGRSRRKNGSATASGRRPEPRTRGSRRERLKAEPPGRRGGAAAGRNPRAAGGCTRSAGSPPSRPRCRRRRGSTRRAAPRAAESPSRRGLRTAPMGPEYVES